MKLALALAAVALLAPTAHAQAADEPTSEVTFYGHVFGLGRGAPMPMNTQFPTGEADLSQGFTGHTCGVDPRTDCEADTQNEAWLYTTAGFVQIKNYQEFDYAKLHNERGLTKDTYLDLTKDVTADFYMSADAHGWLIAACTPGVPRDVPWPVPCWNWDPGVLTQWQVEATLYTGILGEHGGQADTAPDIAAALAAGKLKVLAQGVSAPQDVKSLEPLGNPTVWKFPINLGKPQREVIQKEESYLVRFQWWSVKPDGSKRIVPEMDTWNVNSGETYPPLVRLPVKGAFNVEMVVPQFVYEKMVILGIMNTPWGSYDVDHDSIQLTIKDASGNAVEPRHLARLADFSVAHGGHYKPVNVTYVWDYRADNLPAGTYTATVRASNHQGSASAECTGKFTVTPGGHPGPIEVGQCGVRTISDDQLDTVREGSAGDAKTPAGTADPIQGVKLVGGAVGLLAVFRRWRK